MSNWNTLYRLRPGYPRPGYRPGQDWVVVRISDRRPVFYGTRRECSDWLERNGHDEWR